MGNRFAALTTGYYYLGESQSHNLRLPFILVNAKPTHVCKDLSKTKCTLYYLMMDYDIPVPDKAYSQPNWLKGVRYGYWDEKRSHNNPGDFCYSYAYDS